MSDKMTVLFVKDTGQVVAALTRAADPEAKLAADLLAGEALVLRYLGNPTAIGYGDNEFLIESDELDVLIPDLDTDVIANPRSFIVDENQTVQPANSFTTVTPSFPNTAQIRIAVGAAVAQEAKVRVEIIDLDTSERQVVTGKIAAAAMEVDINLRPLTPLTFHEVLTLVQGFELDRRNIVTP